MTARLFAVRGLGSRVALLLAGALVACGDPSGPRTQAQGPGALGSQVATTNRAALPLQGGLQRWPAQVDAAREPVYTASIDRRRDWTRASIARIVDQALAEETDILVRLVPGVTEEALTAIHGLRLERSIGFESGVHEVSFAPTDAARIAGALAELTTADVVAVNGRYTLSRTPNDALYRQYQAVMGSSVSGGCNAERAWDVRTDGSAVLVAVTDTGVDDAHVDLAGNIAPGGKDFTGKGSYSDGNSHGTHVAGTIGALGNNGLGVAGVCWRARILPVKVLGDDGSGTEAMIAQGIYYAVDAGARIISMSLGTKSASSVMFEALRRARDRGVLVVASAGNDSNLIEAFPNYPASFDLENIISVAAVDANGTLATFSNFGLSVDIAAPGVKIMSTAPQNAYKQLSGTSMAAPAVSGAAALLWSSQPGMTAAQVKSRLLGRARRNLALTGQVANGAQLDVGALLVSSTQPAPAPGLPTFPGLPRF